MIRKAYAREEYLRGFQAFLLTESMRKEGQKKRVRFDLSNLEAPTPTEVRFPSAARPKNRICREPIHVPAGQMSEYQPRRRRLETASQPAYQARFIEYETPLPRRQSQETHLKPEDRGLARQKVTEIKTRIHIRCSPLDTIVVRLTSSRLECTRP